jgi:UDP-glucose 4-epimerase
VTESEPQAPLSPYGWSKLYGERMLLDWARIAPDLGHVALRYFNVAGCAEDGSLGERHDPETHLVPLVLRAALACADADAGRRALTIFGTDYDTPDGTCIRDYVHVEDLVDAHLLCLDALAAGTRLAPAYNVGIGRGYSVREVIGAVEQVTGRPVPVTEGPRRAGDPAALYASATRLERDLGWKARFTELTAIVRTAHRWMVAPQAAEAHLDGGRTESAGVVR